MLRQLRVPAAIAASVSRALAARRCLASQITAANQRTALYDFHVAHGARMVPFAGWDMPLQYENMGHVASHMHVRQKAGLFDVSHMLQTRWSGRDCLAFMESLVVGDIQELQQGSATLSLFTNELGGIIDDTVIQRSGDVGLYVVSNAGCAEKDLAHVRARLEQAKQRGMDANVDVMDEHSLLALQGPSAVAALEQLVGSSLASMPFMTGAAMKIKGIPVHVTRCGYTGEDGFEISVPHKQAAELASVLVGHPDVELAGLAARDSLRLEAGLCLYGNDMDETTSPSEAGLTWTIGKRRRVEGGFLGADKILPQIKGGVSKRRVGLIVEGAPARDKTKIFADAAADTEVGVVTSGCPSPVLKKNVAMAYVNKGHQKTGTELYVKVRNKVQKATVVKMPFVEHNYFRDELYTVEEPALPRLARLDIQKERTARRQQERQQQKQQQSPTTIKADSDEESPESHKPPQMVSSPSSPSRKQSSAAAADKSVYVRKYARLQSIDNGLNDDRASGMAKGREQVRKTIVSLEQYLNVASDYRAPTPSLATSTPLPAIARTSREGLQQPRTDSATTTNSKSNSSLRLGGDLNLRASTSRGGDGDSKSTLKSDAALSATRPPSTTKETTSRVVAEIDVIPAPVSLVDDDGVRMQNMEQSIVSYFSPALESQTLLPPELYVEPEITPPQELIDWFRARHIEIDTKAEIDWPMRRNTPVQLATSRLLELKRQRRRRIVLRQQQRRRRRNESVPVIAVASATADNAPASKTAVLSTEPSRRQSAASMPKTSPVQASVRSTLHLHETAPEQPANVPSQRVRSGSRTVRSRRLRLRKYTRIGSAYKRVMYNNSTIGQAKAARNIGKTCKTVERAWMYGVLSQQSRKKSAEARFGGSLSPEARRLVLQSDLFLASSSAGPSRKPPGPLSRAPPAPTAPRVLSPKSFRATRSETTAVAPGSNMRELSKKLRDLASKSRAEFAALEARYRINSAAAPPSVAVAHTHSAAASTSVSHAGSAAPPSSGPYLDARRRQPGAATTPNSATRLTTRVPSSTHIPAPIGEAEGAAPVEDYH
ncbi:hypothetical protein RI367_005219 [Sorochytrium milnesiophthora]